jgi:transposase
LFAACRPGTDEAFALALPRATTEAMAVFLAAFAQQLETGVHAVLLLDQAGWHCTPKLAVPDNVTLLPLPACSPELNPVERVWLYLRERFLSHRVHRDYAAVLEAACAAWNRLIQETGRLASLTGYPYLMRSEFRSSSIRPCLKLSHCHCYLFHGRNDHPRRSSSIPTKGRPGWHGRPRTGASTHR